MSSFAPTRGPAGTEVTIRGRQFADSLLVYAGGEKVEGASVAPSRISFAIPEGAEGELALTLRASEDGDDIVVGSYEVRDRVRVRAERSERRKQRRRRARERWKERRKELPEQAEARRKRFQDEQDKLRRTREERRSDRAARLRAELEPDFLEHPQVLAELALHAERKARLERMRRLAEIDVRGRLIIRIEVLLDREDERHERRMTTLRAQLL